MQGAKNCVAQVDADGSTLVVALLGVGLVSLIVAANGRRLASVKGPGGAEIGFADPEKKAKEALKGKVDRTVPSVNESKDDGVEPVASPTGEITLEGGAKASIFRLEDVPARVVADLLQELTRAGNLPSNLDPEFIARRPGRGNFPWLFKFRGLPLYRVGYGGQGKVGPTVDPVE